MDLLKILTDGWPVITGAPIPVMMIVAVFAVAAWWLRGKIHQGKIEGMEAENKATQALLKLAREQASAAKDRYDEAQALIENLKTQIDAKASYITLSISFDAANNALHALGDAQATVSGSLSSGVAITSHIAEDNRSGK